MSHQGVEHTNVAPPPNRANVVVSYKDLRMTEGWQNWLRSLLGIVNRAPVRIALVELEDQSASIAQTEIPIDEVNTDLYRVSYAVNISRAATTSSSVTVTIHWTNAAGVACQLSGVAVTGNTTASAGTGTFLIRVLADTTIDYSVAYASVGATSAQFKLDIVVEDVT